MGSDTDTTDIPDPQDAVNTISKLSNNRILPFCVISKEGDISQIEIPVQSAHSTDKKDTAMRRYMTDWLKRHFRVSTDTRFELLPKGISYYTDDKEYPVFAKIVITYWPKPEEEKFTDSSRNRKQT